MAISRNAPFGAGLCVSASVARTVLKTDHHRNSHVELNRQTQRTLLIAAVLQLNPAWPGMFPVGPCRCSSLSLSYCGMVWLFLPCSFLFLTRCPHVHVPRAVEGVLVATSSSFSTSAHQFIVLFHQEWSTNLRSDVACVQAADH